MEEFFSKIIHDKPILIIFGFIFSIFISSFVSLSFQIACFIILCGIICCIFQYRALDTFGDRKFIAVIGIFFIAFGFGAVRYQVKDFHRVDSHLLQQKNTKIDLRATIVSEGRERDGYTEYLGKLSQYGNEKILIRADVYPEFSYGDNVNFQGTLTFPEVFTSKDDKVFDYPAYLAKDDIYLILAFAKGEKISSNNGFFIKERLFKLKKVFTNSIENTISEPESGLLEGILLGSEDSLSSDWNRKFRISGVSHIVVLSGYNITLVAESVLKVLGFLPLNTALLSSSIGIILFAIMVGGGSSVVRASVMAIFVLLARATGRTYRIGRALIIAGACMIFWNPKVLIFDFGFQLSFLATIALIWIAPIIESHLLWCTKRFHIREILASTIATQLAVMPLLLYTMGNFSLLSIAVNVLVLPSVPIAMFFGFFTGLVGIINGIFAMPISALTQAILGYIVFVVDIFSRISFGIVTVSRFHLVFMLMLYIIIFGFLFYLKNRHAVIACLQKLVLRRQH